MSTSICDLSAVDTRSVVRSIETKGYGVVPGFLKPEALDQVRRFVSAAVTRSGGQYVGFTGSELGEGVLADVAADQSFHAFMQQIYSIGTGRNAPQVGFYQVLRCLSGSSVQRHSMNFHYDSYVVTALIPIEIPASGKTGDLLMIPNARRIRQTYIANVFDKVLLDNRVTQVLLRWLIRRRLVPVTRIKPVPGDLYLFWGYRSIHANEACDESKVRATALYHYANPHAGTALRPVRA